MAGCPRGKFSRHYATELALTGDVAESEPVRQLLTDFYREVSPASNRTPLFADLHLERDPQNGYVSAMACQQCHEQEYLQWSATRHAFAYQTLVKKERYFDAGCVSCHTTGFGYPTGFHIADSDTTTREVCSVRPATGPASDMWAIRKRGISGAVRIHPSVCNATTQNIRQGSLRL